MMMTEADIKAGRGLALVKVGSAEQERACRLPGAR